LIEGESKVMSRGVYDHYKIRGKHLTVETKEKMKKAHPGESSWLYGKRGPEHPAYREGNLRFKGYRSVDHGYVLVLRPGRVDTSGTRGNDAYIREHRLIIEQLIGRPLTLSEIGHHRNGIRDDNRPENLMAFTSESAHKRFEKGGIVKPEEIIFDGRELRN